MIDDETRAGANPAFLKESLSIKDNEQVEFRPLEQGDAVEFGVFLEGLSQDTRDRFGPHPLTMQGASEVCQNLDNKTLRLVAFNKKGAIIGYFILDSTFPDTESEDERIRYQREYRIDITDTEDARFAPVISDRYQDRGLGSVLMKSVLSRAEALGKRNVILFGGVQATNARAVHFYEKNGFTKAGEFEAKTPGGGIVNNYDMYINLRQR